MNTYDRILIAAYNYDCYGEICDKDKKEILEALNTGAYSNRINGRKYYDLDLTNLVKDLEKESEIKYPGMDEESQRKRFSYAGNCHTLARKMNEVRQWQIISGYIFERENIDKNSVKLRSHSISIDDHKELIELTDLYSPEDWVFIENSSGKQGIDLKALKH